MGKNQIKSDLIKVWAHLDGDDEALEAFGRLIGGMSEMCMTLSGRPDFEVNDYRDAARELKVQMRTSAGI